MEPAIITRLALEAKDKARMKQGDRQAEAAFQFKRQAHHRGELRRQHARESTEGATYDPGAF